MALSNIFREPRREITESVVGLGIVMLLVMPAIWADDHLAKWLQIAMGTNERPAPYWMCFFLGALLLMMAALLGTAFVVATHALGDAICNALERRDIHLRPRQRH